jgi:TrmH family RNA methyltransferase
MKNFGFNRLVAVNPCKFDNEAQARAMHAKDILESAKIYKRFGNAIKPFDTVVGTTCEFSKSDRHHLRKAITPGELAGMVADIDGSMGILFGREDYGLYNTELKHCDIVVTIPASPEYPSMNLSHSVSIILYEMFRGGQDIFRPVEATGFEKEKVWEMFQIYLDAIDFPMHRRDKATVLMKKILGRCSLSKWEFHTVMGIFSTAVKKIRRESRKKKRSRRPDKLL